MLKPALFSVIGSLWFAVAAAAQLELPAVFSDHMVLQREKPIKVWGWARPESDVSVKLGEREAKATTGRDGRWSVALSAMNAGGPFVMTVRSGDKTVEVSDVYVGEVWLCSGQSNMAMQVRSAQDAEKEIAAADYPLIRMFKESSSPATSPQERGKGTWMVCSPQSVGGFSATAYFFGRELNQSLDVPIGLLNSSVGGTAVEAWTSLEAQADNDAIAPVLEQWKQRVASYDPVKAKDQYERAVAAWEKRKAQAEEEGKRVPRRPAPPANPASDKNHPANLFNGKIMPLIGYGIRGAIWYQGERNANGNLSHLYGDQLEAMITDWRTRWGGDEDFPFAWVQLPNYRKLQTQPSEPSGWVTVREQMMQTLDVPNTGMAVTVDVGQANDIHPKNKQAVGKRLARWALANVYGEAASEPEASESGGELVGESMGPIFQSAKRQGNKMRIRFRFVNDSPPVPEEGLKGFAVAGADRVFHWAQARVVGNELEVWSDAVMEPTSVRYSWSANPIGNFRNQSGLPASPFRTDDWE